MIATVIFQGFPFKAEFFACPFQAINWLIMQRMIHGDAHTFQIETLDGAIYHTL